MALDAAESIVDFNNNKRKFLRSDKDSIKLITNPADLHLVGSYNRLTVGDIPQIGQISGYVIESIQVCGKKFVNPFGNEESRLAFVKWVVENAKPVGFAHANVDTIDPAVRSALAIGPDSINVQFENTDNNPECRSRYTVRNGGVKIHVYTEGGHFDQHIDTQYSAEHVGTVVVGVSRLTEYEGGALQFPAWGKEAETRLDAGQCVAFFTDVEHKIAPVTRGVRVVMQFNVEVCLTTPVDICGDDYSEYKVFEGLLAELSSDYHRKITTLVEDNEHLVVNYDKSIDQFIDSVVRFKKNNPDQANLLVMLRHHYTLRTIATIDDPRVYLKGSDRMFYHALARLWGEKSCHVVGVTVAYVSGYSQGYNDGQVIVKAVDNDLDELEGCSGMLVPVGIDCADSRDCVLHESPYIEHTGNESAPRELIYYSACVIISLYEPEQVRKIE